MKTRRDDDDAFWSMPFGEPIYTHAPEPQVGGTGATHSVSDKPCRKKSRPIGFRPPERHVRTNHKR